MFKLANIKLTSFQIAQIDDLMGKTTILIGHIVGRAETGIVTERSSLSRFNDYLFQR